MSTNKVTDTAAASIWGLLCACLPPECKLPSFPAIKTMLDSAKGQLVRRIDICKNDCIAYYNTRHLPEANGSRHWHRTKCPVCGEPRYIDDPVTGLQQSVKVVYHFPLATFVRSLFRRKDLVKFLFWDCGEHPPRTPDTFSWVSQESYREPTYEQVRSHVHTRPQPCTHTGTVTIHILVLYVYRCIHECYIFFSMYTDVCTNFTYFFLCIHMRLQLGSL